MSLKVAYLVLMVAATALGASVGLTGNELMADGEKQSENLLVYDEKTKTVYDVPDEDIDCILDVGPCSEKMGHIKETLRQALKNDCANCLSEYSAQAGRIAAYMIFKEPHLWQQFTQNQFNKQPTLEIQPESLYEQNVNIIP